MMQIIPANPNKKSFGQRVSEGVERGVETGSRLYDEYQRKQEASENKKKMSELGKTYGIENLGSYSPEIQKEIIAQKLRGENEESQYQRKFQGEAQPQEQKTALDEFGKKYGINKLSLYPPEVIKEIISKKLAGENAEGKQQGQQSYLDRILGNQPQNGNNSKANGKGIMKPEFGGSQGMPSRQEQPEQQDQNKFDIANLSDSDIIIAENMGIKGLRQAKDAAVKKVEVDEKAKQSKFQADREYHSKTSQPIIDAAQQVIKQAPIKQGLIDQQRRDIASGDTSGILNFLIEQSGFEPYRNPAAARFKTATKQRFVESLHELGGSGARPNQFIEQQLVGAQPTLGRSEEANQTVMDLEQFVEDMKVKRAQIELDLAEQDNEKYGFPRNDIGQRANKLMAKYAEERQDSMAYDIRSRKEKNMTDQQLANEIVSGSITPGTPLTIRSANFLMIKNNDDEKKAQAEAKKLGFIIPMESTYKR